MGDFNAKIGTKKDENIKSMGNFGIGERNERGEMLINFAEEERLTISNTFFKKANDRYWTWENPAKDCHNQIDFFLSTDKDIMIDCGVVTNVNVGSDHRMVKAKVKLNKRLMRLERMQRPPPYKIKF